MLRTAVLAAIPLALVASLAPANANAHANANANATSVIILRPAQGAEVPVGEVTLEFATDETGTHTYEYSCDDGTQDYNSVEVWDTSHTSKVTLPSAAPGSACDASLQAPSWASDSVTFSVREQRIVPDVRNVAAPTNFYPLVRDGFRDNAVVGFGTRLDSQVTIAVRNARGATVRTTTLRARPSFAWFERREWTWNGRDRAGRIVAAGRYRVFVISTLDGSTRQASVPVVVATGWRDRAVTKVKDGWLGSTDAVSASCYANEYSDGGNHLDCWGGRYARATYRFAIPAGARGITWVVRGRHLCCDTGRLIRTGERISPRVFRVQVTVTGWRSFVVRRVEVNYRARVRI